VALQCFYVGGVCSSLLVLGGSGDVKSYEWCGADEMRDEILRLVECGVRRICGASIVEWWMVWE
jgi:hypothetical protein